MENIFKVGDKVTVMGSMNNGPSAIRIIESITPKRGDITLENYYGKLFNSSGWEKGNNYGHVYFVAWKPEHSEIMRKNHIRRIITDKDLFKVLSDIDAEKIYEILKPYYDVSKSEKENKL